MVSRRDASSSSSARLRRHMRFLTPDAVLPLYSLHIHAVSCRVAMYVRLFVYDMNPFCLP
jgi:hypothetical protein